MTQFPKWAIRSRFLLVLATFAAIALTVTPRRATASPCHVGRSSARQGHVAGFGGKLRNSLGARVEFTDGVRDHRLLQERSLARGGAVLEAAGQRSRELDLEGRDQDNPG